MKKLALKDMRFIIRSAIKSSIKKPRIKLEGPSDGGKFMGFVISESFVGMTQIDRQDMLWGLIERNLNNPYRDYIIGLLTMTPDEAKVKRSSK